MSAEPRMNAKDAMETAVARTLEAMAFVEALPLKGKEPLPEDMQPAPRTRVVYAKVPLVTPVEGDVYLLLSPELASQLTEMIYGMFEDENLASEITLDAVAEVTNILAGRFLDEYLGEGTAFELGLPEKGEVEEDREVPRSGSRVLSLDYAVEGHTLTVTLTSDELA